MWSSMYGVTREYIAVDKECLVAACALSAMLLSWTRLKGVKGTKDDSKL